MSYFSMVQNITRCELDGPLAVLEVVERDVVLQIPLPVFRFDLCGVLEGGAAGHDVLEVVIWRGRMMG